MADLISEAVITSLFEKKLEDSGNKHTLNKKPSTLLWASSYGPTHQNSSGFLELTETNAITVEVGDNDADPKTKWWWKYGTIVLAVCTIPLQVLSLLLLFIDYGDPHSVSYMWMLVYNLILPLAYAAFFHISFVTSLGIKVNKYVMFAFPVASSLATFTSTWMRGEGGGWPVNLSIVNFFASFCFVGCLCYSICGFLGRKKDSERNWSLLLAVLLIIALFCGWSFACLTLRYFNSSTIFMQSVIVSLLGIWKTIVIQFIKAMTRKTNLLGKQFELLWVAFACVFVHWFWTAFTNIAFAAVESWWTFGIYLVVDILCAGTHLLACSETWHTTNFWKWEPALVEVKEDYKNLNQTRKIFWLCRKILKKVPARREEEEEEEWAGSTRGRSTRREEEIHAFHMEKLFNMSCFLLIQMGECLYAIYSILLFMVCRYGPNGSNSSLGRERLSHEGFAMIITFLLIIVGTEIVTTVVALRLLSRKEKNSINVMPYVGHFMMDWWWLVAAIPMTINLPCSQLLIDHSGMALEIGN